jgi:phosphoserine phosphatase
MKKPLIVFDVDKTLFKGNLHELLIEHWIRRSRFNAMLATTFNAMEKILPHRWLRRRFEYMLISFIREELIHVRTSELLSDMTYINCHVFRRIARYQRFGFDVALITAAPHKVVRGLARQLNTSVHASQLILGFISVDLLAKKSRVYRVLECGEYKIRTVYSDSALDFWHSSKNYLVDDTSLRLSAI